MRLIFLFAVCAPLFAIIEGGLWWSTSLVIGATLSLNFLFPVYVLAAFALILLALAGLGALGFAFFLTHHGCSQHKLIMSLVKGLLASLISVSITMTLLPPGLGRFLRFVTISWAAGAGVLLVMVGQTFHLLVTRLLILPSSLPARLQDQLFPPRAHAASRALLRQQAEEGLIEIPSPATPASWSGAEEIGVEQLRNEPAPTGSKLFEARSVGGRRFLKMAPNKWRRVALTTADGMQLDAMELSLRPEVRRWTIYMLGNAGFYELLLDYYTKFAFELDTNFLCFNYRGAGSSSGLAWGEADIAEDGVTAFTYLLKSKGAQPSDILIYGQSLGAAVGTRVRAKFPGGPLLHDRSFRSLSAVPESWLLSAFKPLLSYGQNPDSRLAAMDVDGVAVANGARPESRNAGSKDEQRAATIRMLADKGFKAAVGVIRFVLDVLQWRFDITQDFKNLKGKKVVLFHERDEIIDFSTASLHSNLRLAQPQGDLDTPQMKVVELHVSGPSPHNARLDDDPRDWAEARRLVNWLFERSE